MSRRFNSIGFKLLCIELDSLDLQYTDYNVRGSKRILLSENNLSLRVIAGEGEHFVVRKSFFEESNILFIYIWDVLDDPQFFILSASDIEQVCGPLFLKQNSGKEWNLPLVIRNRFTQMRRKIMFEHFHETWNRIIEFDGSKI